MRSNHYSRNNYSRPSPYAREQEHVGPHRYARSNRQRREPVDRRYDSRVHEDQFLEGYYEPHRYHSQDYRERERDHATAYDYGDRLDRRHRDRGDNTAVHGNVYKQSVAPPTRVSRERTHRPAVVLGYDDLQQLLTAGDSADLLRKIVNESSGFPDALNNSDLLKSPANVSCVLSVIATALGCHTNPETKRHLLNTVASSAFAKRHLSSYFTQMTTERSPAKIREFQQPIKDSLTMYDALLTLLPETISDNICASFKLLDRVVLNGLQGVNVVDDGTRQSAADIRARMLSRSDHSRRQTHDGEPPNDFRGICVFPDVRTDFSHRSKPSLRPIVDKGNFDGPEHFLDVHFRLLREDFIRPLREAICRFAQPTPSMSVDDASADAPNQADVRVYHDVRVLNPVCTESGIGYRIQFDASRTAEVQWMTSKRLIYGSLLCLSSDEFKTILVATVLERNPRELRRGELVIRFGNDDAGGSGLSSAPDERFLMVETAAYFESARHVLAALQMTHRNDIPFLDNIVYARAYVDCPQYLKKSGKCLVNLKGIASSPDSADDDRISSPVDVFDLKSWPPGDCLGLDDSQLRALHAALTKRLAIIQGPPGTGKTYIGTKIVRVLLDNAGLWNRDCPSGPILVVCYTNHALDQFLEGLCPFVQTGMVRVGNRSRSERLERFRLSLLRQGVRDCRGVPSDVRGNQRAARELMDAAQEELEKRVALIAGTDRGILREGALREWMSVEHYEQFARPDADEHRGRTASSRSSVIADWLDVEGILSGRHPVTGMSGRIRNTISRFRRTKLANDDDGQEWPDDSGTFLDNQFDDQEDDDDRQFRQQERRRRNDGEADELLAVNVGRLPAADVDAKMSAFQAFLNSADVTLESEAAGVHDLWSLSIDDRWRLYRFWLRKYRASLREQVVKLERDYQIAANFKKESHEAEDFSLMRKMKIVGMTTTAASRYINTLRRIRPKIVIVEEAAEVLEAHVIATLSGHCQHLILIGDHKQLRPSPNVHELAEKYNLKYSLFERLINNDLPFETLKKQHRMRPEIADLVRFIYRNELVDDESVMRHEQVKGVARNVFFISHEVQEQQNAELKSASNEHEARYLVALCKHLLLQGYRPEQLTLLTPYTGQLFLLQKLLRQRTDLKGVRPCTIDKYQGEENDIVLLSTVRSNPDNKIGFMKEENRVCVALSRARIGLYVIGNFRFLADHSRTWNRVISKAKEADAVGPALRLCCQNHPVDDCVEARLPSDFDPVPEGGCARPCDFRLGCGHVCARTCHPDDRDHSAYRCRKPCRKPMCDRGHPCPKMCSDVCGPCKKLIIRRLPDCGHLQKVPCGVPVEKYRCKFRCAKRLKCGHPCANTCGAMHTTCCQHQVVKNCSKGHVTKIKCYQRKNNIQCTERCTASLDCLHGCSGTCGDCFAGRLHVSCTSSCGRTLFCGHSCTEPCTNVCPPCSRPCGNRCKHSRCRSACGQPCVPCVEPCLWKCVHYDCTKFCHEPCDRPRCNQPCQESLPCGHPCVGMCGERCPKLCGVCDREELTEIFFGNEDKPEARFVQLDDCGHVFEVSDLDTWMEQDVDSEAGRLVQLKQCPKCRVPIRTNLRYGTLINRTLADINAVKKKTIGDSKQNEITAKRLMTKIHQRRCANDMTYYVGRLTQKNLSVGELTCIENIINFNQFLSKCQTELQDRIGKLPSTCDSRIRANFGELKSAMTSVQSRLEVPRYRLSPQEELEYRMEITRLEILSGFCDVDAKISGADYAQITAELRTRFDETMNRLKNGDRLDESTENEAREVLREVRQRMSGIGVTDEERLQILKALDFHKPGRWFTCPNGHPYVIGECGGAMQESQCPECGAKIGGSDHRLRGDNRFLADFDGAQTSAFPGMDANR